MKFHEITGMQQGHVPLPLLAGYRQNKEGCTMHPSLFRLHAASCLMRPYSSSVSSILPAG